MGQDKPDRLQKNRKLLPVLSLFVVGLTLLIILGYAMHWSWTGFNASLGPNVRQYESAKTLWDWMQLLIIPGGLALIAFWFNATTSHNEQQSILQRERTARDDQWEVLLQTYLDRMSELLLNSRLREPNINPVVRDIARARTLTVLSMLDPSRKASVIHFLYEAGLIKKNTQIGTSIICLREADLSQVDLTRASLREVDLRGANLSDAILKFASLDEANLDEANLSQANLTGASLSDASLIATKLGAKLNGANLRRACLNKADLREADVYMTNLSRADLSAANLVGLDLIDADIDDATFTNETNFDRAKLSQEQKAMLKEKHIR